MELNYFMTILLLESYFKINGWIYKGILGVLVKNSLNLISSPPISLKFGGMKFEVLREQRGMSVSYYPFNFLLFKLPNKIMDLSLPQMKLLNKRREKYSKSILFIHLHFISFHSSKRRLRPRPCHQCSKINVFLLFKRGQ